MRLTVDAGQPVHGGFMLARRENSRELVPVDRCPLMIDAVNATLDGCRAASEVPGVREIHAASNGRDCILSFPGVPRDERIVERFDFFPNTHHVETLAVFAPGQGSNRRPV